LKNNEKLGINSLHLIILASWEAEIRKMVVQGQHGQQKRNPYQAYLTQKGLSDGSRGRAPAWQAHSLRFKPQFCKKKKKKMFSSLVIII
jgi:hypothetical protein